MHCALDWRGFAILMQKSSMGTIAIFPSLSRAPSMDSSEQVEDDTIRDEMEIGYVATRPRFTRARRSWNVNVRNLVAEDVRALRNFRDNTVKRGALPFYYPNLLPNSSFEFPSQDGNSDLVDRWYFNDSGGTDSPNIFHAPIVAEGNNSIVIETVPGAIMPAGAYSFGSIVCSRQLQVISGQVYQCVASVAPDSFGFTAGQGGIGTGSGLGGGVGLYLVIYFTDGTNTNVSLVGVLNQNNDGNNFIVIGGSAAIPDYPGKTIAYANFGVYADIGNRTGTLITFRDDNTLGVVAQFDSVGLALTSSPIPQIEMAGSAPITAPVRFAKDGMPKFSDLGIIGGVKRYGTTFTLEEV